MEQLNGREDGQVSLDLAQRRAVVKELSPKYARVSKKDRGQMLDLLVGLTGYNRCYASRALLSSAKLRGLPGFRRRAPGAGRKPVYNKAVLAPLTRIWAVLDFPAGKRLAPFLPEIVPILIRLGELHISKEVLHNLMSISPATIDRLLAPERKKLALKGRTGTKPGTLLKHSIPIKTFAEWDDSKPGFLEIDLVAHDGGNPKGEYSHTLDMTDVTTGWTEIVAVKNKAQRWVFEALKDVIARLPFPVRGIDSDNGSEFINDHFVRFCNATHITFTRSRPHRKNDSCFVEQKNWSVVRKTVGYLRYDSEAHLNTLNELYRLLRLYTNYFQPTAKLISKERKGARVKKTYDDAKTPYQRVLLQDSIPEEIKARLTTEYASLNPVALKAGINRLQQKLIDMSLPNNAIRTSYSTEAAIQ